MSPRALRSVASRCIMRTTDPAKKLQQKDGGRLRYTVVVEQVRVAKRTGGEGGTKILWRRVRK